MKPIGQDSLSDHAFTFDRRVKNAVDKGLPKRG